MGPYVYPAVTHTLSESQEMAGLFTEIDTHCREMILKFILGTESLDNYDKFIEVIRQMGIERVLEMKRAAYQRFISR